jgi:hypothetical protein
MPKQTAEGTMEEEEKREGPTKRLKGEVKRA